MLSQKQLRELEEKAGLIDSIVSEKRNMLK